MNGKVIKRKTKVISLSFDPTIAKMLDQLAKEKGQSRSAVMAPLIKYESWKRDWERIREYGQRSAKKLGITSEEDIYKLTGDA